MGRRQRRDTADSRRISFGDWPDEDLGHLGDVVSDDGRRHRDLGDSNGDCDCDGDGDDVFDGSGRDEFREMVGPPASSIAGGNNNGGNGLATTLALADAAAVEYSPSSSFSPPKGRRNPSLGGESVVTTAASSLTGPSASSSSSSSSSSSTSGNGSGGNVWNRVLSHRGGRGDIANGSYWDKLDGKDVWDDDEYEFEDGGRRHNDGGGARAVLAVWYEMRHFAIALCENPTILLTSLATFGMLCGIGMALVIAERDAYAQKQRSVAEFVVS
jgi:hypothetical protein